MRLRKLMFILLSVLLIALLSACQQTQAPEQVETVDVEEAQPAEEATEAEQVEVETEAEPPAEVQEETAAPASQGDRSDIRIVVVSHGQASDPFWSVVSNGVAQAGEDMGVTVEYQAPQTYDMVAMSQLIDAAVATNPDGLVVSIPDADALGDSIRSAVDAGIPVISMNSGSDVAKELGILTHVGQTEYEAGFADALAETGGTAEVLVVDLADPIDAQQRIVAGLTANPDIDGVLALGPTGAAPALAALTEEGLLGEIQLATSDLSPEVLEAIRDGDMLFAIDQQQYLQGYLPIVLLTLLNANLNTIANDVVMTGPGFVVQDTAAQVIDLAAAGTR